MSLENLADDLRSIADEYDENGLTTDVLDGLEQAFFSAETVAFKHGFD